MNAGVTEDRRLGLAAIAALALAALLAGEGSTAAAGFVLVGGVDVRSRGMAGLVGWIVAGAVLGGVAGYAAAATLEVPLSAGGAAGLGLALGGGMGGISHLLSTDDPASVDDESMTVDMASDSAAEPRPADLFDDHPDPVLYVADAGAGPVVRAANAAYEDAFDLPAATIEDAPLSDVLVVEDGGDELADRVAAGERVDEVLSFETPEGSRRYRVRSVAATADGYLLFTPVGE